MRDGTPQSDQYSSQASATSAKRKRGQRGKYRSLALEKKTLGGQFKLEIEIPDYVLQAVGENARMMVNFCGYVVRTTTFMDAGDWPQVFAKYGNSMWLQVKNKFNIKDSNTQILRFQAFATDAMQRLYRSERNKKNRNSNKWYKHTTGPLSFPEVKYEMANGGELPTADFVWLVQHTHTNKKGVLELLNEKRSKEVHAQLHQLAQDKDKEPEDGKARLQTQGEMLLHVLGSKSSYTRGKGSGYGGSSKAKLQQEQQQNLRKQQDQIAQLQCQLEIGC